MRRGRRRTGQQRPGPGTAGRRLLDTSHRHHPHRRRPSHQAGRHPLARHHGGPGARPLLTPETSPRLHPRDRWEPFCGALEPGLWTAARDCHRRAERPSEHRASAAASAGSWPTQGSAEHTLRPTLAMAWNWHPNSTWPMGDSGQVGAHQSPSGQRMNPGQHPQSPRWHRSWTSHGCRYLHTIDLGLQPQCHAGNLPYWSLTSTRFSSLAGHRSLGLAPMRRCGQAGRR